MSTVILLYLEHFTRHQHFQAVLLQVSISTRLLFIPGTSQKKKKKKVWAAFALPHSIFWTLPAIPAVHESTTSASPVWLSKEHFVIPNCNNAYVCVAEWSPRPISSIHWPAKKGISLQLSQQQIQSGLFECEQRISLSWTSKNSHWSTYTAYWGPFKW